VVSKGEIALRYQRSTHELGIEPTTRMFTLSDDMLRHCLSYKSQIQKTESKTPCAAVLINAEPLTIRMSKQRFRLALINPLARVWSTG
jgi:hypothetical protein